MKRYRQANARLAAASLKEQFICTDGTRLLITSSKYCCIPSPQGENEKTKVAPGLYERNETDTQMTQFV